MLLKRHLSPKDCGSGEVSTASPMWEPALVSCLPPATNCSLGFGHVLCYLKHMFLPLAWPGSLCITRSSMFCSCWWMEELLSLALHGMVGQGCSSELWGPRGTLRGSGLPQKLLKTSLMPLARQGVLELQAHLPAFRNEGMSVYNATTAHQGARLGLNPFTPSHFHFFLGLTIGKECRRGQKRQSSLSSHFLSPFPPLWDHHCAQ
jgi:hypothetical protein